MKTHHLVGPNMWRMPWFLFIGAVLVLSGCATPVGVRHLDLKEANRKLTESVLSEDQLSAPTLQILNRSGLAKKYLSEPAEVIAALNEGIPTARETDRIFALAELSFLHLEDVEAGLREGRLEGNLVLSTIQESTSVSVGGRRFLWRSGRPPPWPTPWKGHGFIHWSSRGCSRETSNSSRTQSASRTTCFSWHLTAPAGSL